MGKFQKCFVSVCLTVILAAYRVDTGPVLAATSESPRLDLEFPQIPRTGLKDPFSEDQIAELQTQMMNNVAKALAKASTGLTPDERAKLIASVASQSAEVLSATPSSNGSVGVMFSDGTPFVYMAPRPANDLPEPSPSPDVTASPSPTPSAAPTSSPTSAPTTCPGLPPEVQWPPGIPCPDLGDDDGGLELRSSLFSVLKSTNTNTAASHLLSEKAKAVLVDVDGLGNTNTAYLRGLFQKKGYAPISLRGTSQELRTQVQNVNFLWMASHSATTVFEVQGRRYPLMAIQIGDPASSAGATCPAGTPGDSCRAIQRQNRPDEQALHMFRGSIDAAGTQTRWFISRGFILKYWSFVPESIAIMDICSTGAQTDDAAQLRGNLRQKKAHTIAGWSDVVTVVGAVPVVKRFVDRILGANEYAAPTPKQRPFSAEDVYEYMANNGYVQDAYGRGRLVIDIADTAKVLLVPSIKSLEVDEQKDTMTIRGEFGVHPKKVTVAGTEVQVKEWKAREIKVALPRSGAGSFGDVLIESDSRKSNATPLTQWIGKIKTKIITGIHGKPGPWAEANCSKVKIRGDVHKFRDLPGQQLQAGQSGMKKTYFAESARMDFSCTWSVGGQGQMGGCRNVVDANGGSLRWSSNVPEEEGLSPYRDNYFLFVGNIDIEARKLIFIPAATFQFKMKTYCIVNGREVLVAESPSGNLFNGNGTVQNWSQLYPHSADRDWNFTPTEMSIPDLQGMPNQRTLYFEFPAQAIPTENTES